MIKLLRWIQKYKGRYEAALYESTVDSGLKSTHMGVSHWIIQKYKGLYEAALYESRVDRGLQSTRKWVFRRLNTLVLRNGSRGGDNNGGEGEAQGVVNHCIL